MSSIDFWRSIRIGGDAYWRAYSGRGLSHWEAHAIGLAALIEDIGQQTTQAVGPMLRERLSADLLELVQRERLAGAEILKAEEFASKA